VAARVIDDPVTGTPLCLPAGIRRPATTRHLKEVS
jgi:hypothetical protein